MATCSPSNQTSPGRATALGLPFFVGGLIMMVFGLHWWGTYYRSASWIRTPATILSIEWVLEAKAATPGVDFAVKFEDLPVYTVDDPALVDQRPGR